MSEKKRMFQILDEMNQEDITNNTAMVEITNAFVAGNKVKQGAHITMGAPERCLIDLMTDKKIAILLLVDREEYFKRDNFQ